MLLDPADSKEMQLQLFLKKQQYDEYHWSNINFLQRTGIIIIIKNNNKKQKCPKNKFLCMIVHTKTVWLICVEDADVSRHIMTFHIQVLVVHCIADTHTDTHFL